MFFSWLVFVLLAIVLASSDRMPRLGTFETPLAVARRACLERICDEAAEAEIARAVAIASASPHERGPCSSSSQRPDADDADDGSVRDGVWAVEPIDGSVLRQNFHADCLASHDIFVKIAGVGDLLLEKEEVEVCILMDVESLYMCIGAEELLAEGSVLRIKNAPHRNEQYSMTLWAQRRADGACLGRAGFSTFTVACDEHDAPISPVPHNTATREPKRPGGCVDTTVGRCELYTRLARHVALAGVEGDFVETGVWVGHSATAVGEVWAQEFPESSKRLWLFDSWEGMPPAAEEKDGRVAVRLSPEGEFGDLGWGSEATPEGVANRLRQVGVREGGAILRQGWFEDTFVQQPLPERISFLNIDCDWYQSVYDSLEAFYDKVSPGGVVMFDDFAFWEGARVAFFEFFAARGEAPLVEREGTTNLWFIKGKQHNRPPGWHEGDDDA